MTFGFPDLLEQEANTLLIRPPRVHGDLCPFNPISGTLQHKALRVEINLPNGHAQGMTTTLTDLCTHNRHHGAIQVQHSRPATLTLVLSNTAIIR